MNGGEVRFNFKGDTGDIEKKTNGLASKLGSAGKVIGGAFVKGSLMAGTALTGLVGASVKMYADVEQSVGGVETLFKDSANTVIENSKKAYMTAGISANDYMQQVTSFSASLLQSLGGDTEKASQYADRAIVDMADNANKMGTSIESIQNAYQGFAKQNYTMLDNLKLGYGGTQSEMKRLIQDASKLTDVQNELGVTVDKNDMSFGNIVNAISVMQKKMDIAGTTSKEASETISGSVQSAKAAFENFLAGTGNIDEVIKTFTTAGTNITNGIIEMAPKIVNGIVGLINGIVPQLPGLIQTLLPVLLDGVVNLAMGLVNALPQFISVLTGMLPTLITSLINGLIMIINALAVQLPVLIPQIIDAIMEVIPLLIDNLPLFLEAGAKLLLGLIQGVLNSLPKLLTGMAKVGKSMINYWKQVPSMLKNIGGNLIKGLWQGIVDYEKWIIGKIKSIGGSILKAIKGVFGIHSPSKEFAIVGKFNMLGLEKGMEDMAPEVQDTIDSMFDLSPSLYGSSSTNLSPNINVVVNNNMKQDPLGQMVNNIKTYSGGAKNDYNYGMA